MLINLSSNGELDPAKFANTFSEGMVIKPNSYVCLVSASVIEDLNNKLPRRGIDVINATNTLLKFGMDNIILLDGGGSSILLVNINGKAKRLNTPSGNKFGNFIGKERYVGNYVGFDFVKKN